MATILTQSSKYLADFLVVVKTKVSCHYLGKNVVILLKLQ